MYLRKKKFRSGNTGIIVVEKINGKMKELVTIGITNDEKEIEVLLSKGRDWIEKEISRRQPRLDLFGEETKEKEEELKTARRFISQIKNITINGADIILDKVFASIGFNQIEDKVFRSLVKSRLSYPVSKSATVEYLKNHFDKDVSLSKIYWYMDKLRD